LRDLIRLAKVRPGLLPVLADARKPETLSPWLPNRVPWLFQDVSQAGQVDLFLGAAKNFLAPNGLALLSLKSASERISAGGAEEQYAAAAAALSDAGLDVLEVIELTGWEEQHALITGRAPSDWQR
jgi:fibrillarin-like rRNA methylase